MFRNRIPLFKLSGFQVWVDWSWLLLAVLVAWSLRGGVFPEMVKGLTAGTYWTMGVLGALGLFFSIVIHEFAHSVVARKRGLPMAGITLFIFGGVAEMTEEPASPATEFWMAIAGPAMSVVVGLVFLAIGELVKSEKVAWAMFSYLGRLNLILAAFNMIPAFPLDGGRVFRSILWHFKGDLRKATHISSMVGSGFGLLLMLLGFFAFLNQDVISGVWYFLIGSFVRNAAETNYRQVVIRKELEGEKVSRFMNRRPAVVPSYITIRELIETYISHNYHKSYPVADDDKVVGIITVDHVKALSEDQREVRSVGQEAEPVSSKNCISANADAMEALEKMQQSERSLLIVIDDGELEGIVTLKDISALLEMKMKFKEAGDHQPIPPPMLKK